MGFVGIVPSEWSSGDSERRGALTRTGNAQVRRVLIDAAWHYRHRPSIGPTLRRPREGQPGWESRSSWRSPEELVGLLWAVLHEGLSREEAETSRKIA